MQTATLLLLFAIAQPPSVPGDPPVVAQGPPVIKERLPKPAFPTYEAADAIRLNDGTPFVAFVGVKPRVVQGTTTTTLKQVFHKDKWQLKGIMVVRKDGYVWLPPTASDMEIRQAAGLAVQPRASFFGKRPAVDDLPIADDDLKAAGQWPQLLDDMTPYTPTINTQQIYNIGEKTDKVSRLVTEDKWHQSGGMLGVYGFHSTLYKYIPYDTVEKADKIWVKHATGSTGQYEVGLARSYPDGTRFVDRLRNEDGEDFEARLRFKKNGNWFSKVVFSDPTKRPAGYHGIKQSCASCHDEAGTGVYGAGLVPGSDTVLSDELPWELLSGLSQQQRQQIRRTQ